MITVITLILLHAHQNLHDYHRVCRDCLTRLHPSLYTSGDKSGKFCHRKSRDCFGHDIKEPASFDEAASCLETCVTEAACKSVQYNTNTKQCFLKDHKCEAGKLDSRSEEFNDYYRLGELSSSQN